MPIDRMQRLLLLLMSAGLVPVALSYGAAPGVSLPWLLGIDASGVNARNVFRALMGLYLAMAAFWALGALRPALRRPALFSLFVFVTGVALGRLLSLALDGAPHPLLTLYLVLELAISAASLGLIRASGCAT